MEVRDHKTTKLKNENFEYGAGVAGCGTGVAVPGSSKTRNKKVSLEYICDLEFYFHEIYWR